MDQYQTLTRLIAHVGRLDGARLQAGRLLASEQLAFHKAVGTLERAPIHLDVDADRTLRDVRAASRRLKASRGLALVVVDYLQLLRSHASERARTREEEVARFSRGLKALAKELDVPVLALAQLSREAERADQGEPRLSHLRESGALEQDADVVLLLWRPSLHDATQPKDLVCLKVAKNRQGPTGAIDLRFLAEQFRFLDWRDEPPPADLFGDGQRAPAG
jgi:replicative DNA helicase